MPCAFNKCAKINSCIGIVIAVIGGILLIAALTSTAAGFDIETTGGSSSFTVNMDSDCNYGLYIRASDTCEGSYPVTTPMLSVSHVASGTMSLPAPNSCGMIYTDSESNWEAAHDPALREVGSFSAVDDPLDCGHTDHCTQQELETGQGLCIPQCRTLMGPYRVTSSTNVWAVDWCEELGEALGGLVGGFILMVIGGLMGCIGSTFCLVACCCCCQGPDQPKYPPPAVQGQVVGQPVAMAVPVVVPVEGQA